jgi:3-deoxy-manno-octulosonate cytidylyltransferase (CMP-KDO synthetase)
MKILCVIPARYGSTRFPGKALVDIRGKSMVQRVYEQVNKATGILKTIVATDHDLIYADVKKFGGNVCMTSDQHINGSERCNEVLQLESDTYDYIINVQGDEPFISPDQINLLINILVGDCEIGSLCKHISQTEAIFNANTVKVVKNISDEALYFSRAPIPHQRSQNKENWLDHHKYYKHIGIYGFRTDILPQLVDLPPASLELAESLEQLRWLENGFKIKLAETYKETIGIDIPEDLERAISYMKLNGIQ